MIYKQKGAVPIIVLIALVSAVFGGYIGFNLGGGTFFSFGVGVAVVFLRSKKSTGKLLAGLRPKRVVFSSYIER